MQGIKRWIVTTLLLILVASTAHADAPDFDARVAPILARRCLDCHSGAEPKGGLDLSRKTKAMAGGDSGEVIVPGKLDESPLWELIADGTMPPKTRLPADERDTLRAWIEAGARWGTDPIDPFRTTTERRAGRDWWSLGPVVRPDVRPGANPIDFFVRRSLSKAGLVSSPRADRRTLVRRLTFDLTGLPPTPEEVEAFVKDENPSAYDRLVDRLLASPQYGPRWARPWLDLARFGESNGFEHDEFRPDAWRYRDWVVNALNSDMPYDEFARLQIAGDVLHPDDPAAIEATGFLVAGAYDSVGQTQQSDVMRKVVRQDDLEDVVGTVSQAFLGLTVHCARCHDHKFDPIRQVEYYRFAAALSGVRHGERDLTALDPETKAAGARIADRNARLAAIEATVPGLQTGPRPPAPLAAWDFSRGLEDRSGQLNASIRGPAIRSASGLVLDGKAGFAATVPLKRDVRARTLEAWVRLDDLAQRGGAVIGVQTPDGSAFDAIVFGELEPGRWMAGSEGFARSKSFNAPVETDAARRPVHVAIAYAEDGTITAYRDGKLYGTPYRTSSPVTFRAGLAQVVFGLRHPPVGGNRMLAGTVVRAGLYDRALTSSEVAASAHSGGEFPSIAAIEAALRPDLRAMHVRLRLGNDADRAELSRQVRRTYAVSPRPPEPSHLLTRGNPATPAEIVSAGALGAVAAPPADFGLRPDAPEADRRIKISRWITDPANPLFPRVIVNRLWLGHFGAGLVETPSDFGFNGGRPSHPELLDWLASELVARRWSLKALHRLIVTSETYQQTSHPDPASLRADAADRLLWRKAPARLEAEMVRDAMLAVSGELDPSLGGPGFREFSVQRAPGTITNLYAPIDTNGPEFARRTIYRTWSRGFRSGFLDAFDCPDPSTTAPRRAVTTTPQQALAMLNNALTLRLADRLAARLLREAGPDPRRQAERAYRLAYGRSPSAEEADEAARLITDHGAAALARAIFNSNEFLYVD